MKRPCFLKRNRNDIVLFTGSVLDLFIAIQPTAKDRKAAREFLKQNQQPNQHQLCLKYLDNTSKTHAE